MALRFTLASAAYERSRAVLEGALSTFLLFQVQRLDFFQSEIFPSKFPGKFRGRDRVGRQTVRQCKTAVSEFYLTGKIRKVNRKLCSDIVTTTPNFKSKEGFFS